MNKLVIALFLAVSTISAAKLTQLEIAAPIEEDLMMCEADKGTEMKWDQNVKGFYDGTAVSVLEGKAAIQ